MWDSLQLMSVYCDNIYYLVFTLYQQQSKFVMNNLSNYKATITPEKCLQARQLKAKSNWQDKQGETRI